MLLLAGACLAQIPDEANPAKKRAALPTTVKVEQAAQLTKEDLEAFLDGFVPMELEQQDIAGAVVCVVKDGKVLFAKGYGFADVKNRKPVTVDATLFRPGSISKTFTWTAVMQLYEQGKLDLDRDVNAYIDFRIPAKFGAPVTLKNIMSHMPGFEEAIQDLLVSNAADLRPLNVYLPTHLPQEIFPPGTTPAYSNYAATLAGYIVQRVSGMPFDDYVDNNIFKPLGMNHSTFRQPLPPNLAAQMSNGYEKASGEPKGFEYGTVEPAGSLASTAEDMSHWMVAHLQDGEYNGAHILKPETARLMHSRLWTNVPQLNGGAYGFYEQSRNGHRSIGHGGDTQWFHSDMYLMVDDHVGLFWSANSAGKGEVSVREALWQQFTDRYFPYTARAGQKVANSKEDIQSIVGTYWNSRRAHTDIAAVTAALSQTKVTANSDGTISVAGFSDYAGNPKHFEEIAPMVFREAHGQEQIGFKKDWQGRDMFAFDFPFMVFERAPALKNGKFNEFVIGFAVGVFALTLLAWPIAGMFRRHYGHRPDLAPQYRRLRIVMRIVCLLDLAFILLFVAWVSSIDKNLAALSTQYQGRLHALQALGLLGLIASIVSVFYCVRSWATGSLWIWTRIWNTLLLIACLAYVFCVLNWHMLNFRLVY